MRRADRQRWAGARSLAEVGALTVAWLNGELLETPSHCAPPDPETIPHIPTLIAANLAGFVTENSQSASSPADVEQYGAQWNAWVGGFVTDSGLERLGAAIDGTPLVLETRCRGREHHGHRGRWWRCPRRDLDGFYGDRCPHAADEIAAAWYVMLADPEPSRNDRLWGALDRFALTPPPVERKVIMTNAQLYAVLPIQENAPYSTTREMCPVCRKTRPNVYCENCRDG